MKRFVTILVGIVILLAAVLGAVFVVLAMSEPGTRFIAAQAERLLPLRIEDVHGSLWRRLTAARVTYELDARVIVIEDLAVELRLFPVLFDNRLVLESVRAARIEVQDTGRPRDDAPPARLVLPFMPIDIRLDRLEIDRVELPGAPVIEVDGAGEWTSRGVSLTRLSVRGEAIEVGLQGTLGAGSRPALDAEVDWALPQAGWSGSGTFAGAVDALAVRHAVRGEYVLDLTGTVNLSVPAQPAFDLAFTVDDVALDAYTARDIAGRLAGDLAALVLEVGAQAATPYGEPFPVTAIVRGPAVGPVRFEGRAEPLDGVADVNGTLDWRTGLAIEASGRAVDLDLAPLLDGRAGRAGARWSLRLVDGEFDVTLTDVAGAIDGRQLAGGGHVYGSGRTWRADAVELSLGDNTAAFEGSWIDGALVLAGRVDAPALEQLALGIDGDLDAVVDVAGTWPALDGTLRATSTGVTYTQTAVRRLALDARFTEGRLQAELAAAQVQAADLVFETPRLTASGTVERVDWRLGWSAGGGEGRLRVDDGNVRVDVAAFRVEALDNDFALVDPLVVSVAGGDVTVSATCVAGADARACVERFALTAGRIDTAGRLERLPLALFDRLLPLQEGNRGYLEGDWRIAGAAGAWTGDVTLAGRGLAVVMPDAPDQVVELPDVEFAGELVGGGLDVRVRARDGAFSLAGAARLASLDVAGALSGTIELDVDDLGWVRALDQRIAELGGTIAGRAVLSGQAGAPRVQGLVELRDGRLLIEDPEVRLDAVALTARLDETGVFEFSGSATQPRGSVAVSGAGSGLFDGALAFEAALEGAGLRAEHPQWEVEVTPDLAVRYAQGIARVTGTVELPKAAVRLSTLPTTVPRPSADVVVLGRDEAVNGEPNRLRMNVRVVLGRDVSLRGFGIQADLEGALTVRRDARGQTSLRGTLDITGGLLSAQGQTLAIESGTVIYNGPIDNPYLDLRAVRTISTSGQTVKAGLHIRGNADRLQSTVYSEPAMDENRALAFLVLGRDINEGSEADSGQLLTAAINLGLSQSRSLTSELQRITGLDEFSAMAEAQDSFAIVAGKRVTEDIYVRYTYNTLSAIGAFLISFDLTDRWRLEASSGESSAMDILYRIER